MSELATDFALLGGRDYVNAGTLLNAFLRVLESEAAGAITVSRLKAQKIARANGRLVLVNGVAIDGIDEANCTLAAKVRDGEWRGAFFDEGRPARTQPAPQYTVSDVEAAGFGGRCRIAPANRTALVFDLIQANRRFHELSAGLGDAPVVRFGYLENWDVPPADIAFSGTVEAKNLIARKTANGILTINRVTYASSPGTATSLMLCFEIAPDAKERA